MNSAEQSAHFKTLSLYSIRRSETGLGRRGSEAVSPSCWHETARMDPN
jgi:hypothetical protein